MMGFSDRHPSLTRMCENELYMYVEQANSNAMTVDTEMPPHVLRHVIFRQVKTLGTY